MVKKSVQPISACASIGFLIEAEKLCGGLASQDFEAKKYYPKRSVGVEIYLSKPEGHGLDCRRGLNLPLQKSQEES